MSAPMNLASYATLASNSRGRVYREPDSPGRTAFQRDRDRIVHSGAFRKLQYKTQVFVYHEGDYFRTRLTHSLEVAQIARSIARALQIDEDLCEALALAHDLGHTPFGHAGERELSDVMESYGGFDHNEQTFRIVTRLEPRYADFDGLNLTWETLEGIVKHNGPLATVRQSYQDFSDAHFDLEFTSFPGLEAQVAALSDDIAYNNHDIDDGLRAGLIDFQELLELPLVGETFKAVRRSYPDLEEGRWIHEANRRLISLMINDVIEETKRRLEDLSPSSADALRSSGRPMVAFSETMMQNQTAIRQFLYRRVYRHYKVNRVSFKVRKVVSDLFEAYMAHPRCLPEGWQLAFRTAEDKRQAARVVADYIAGMTDRYALEAHAKLFDPYVRL